MFEDAILLQDESLNVNDSVNYELITPHFYENEDELCLDEVEGDIHTKHYTIQIKKKFMLS